MASFMHASRSVKITAACQAIHRLSHIIRGAGEAATAKGYGGNGRLGLPVSTHTSILYPRWKLRHSSRLRKHLSFPFQVVIMDGGWMKARHNAALKVSETSGSPI